MNCKPGQLALIVKTGKNTTQMAGKVIRVIKRAPDVRPVLGLEMDVRIVWDYEPKLRSDLGNLILLANDCCLRPINNPGDSARDNAWDWLPAVPTKELA